MPFFVFFRSVRKKLQFTVFLDHPVNVIFAIKTAFQSYSAADHIMRKHSPPLPTLNTPEQRREKSKTNDNVAQTAATLAGMFPLWLKVHSQIIPLQLTL